MRAVVVIVMFVVFAFGDVGENSINGIWEIQEEVEGFVSIGEIFTKDNRACAYAFAYAKKVDGVLIPREVGDENKNADNLKGKVFLSHLEFNGKRWINGRIYNPNNDKIYYAEAYLSEDEETLFIKASIDSFGIIGITLKWYRIHDGSYTPLNHDEVVFVDKLKEIE